MAPDTHEGRADSTRRRILRAAAHQFARRPYHEVGLDDILAEAQLTKGAMYFHFRSKHELAVAIIEEHIATSAVAIEGLVARRLSGLETLIDFTYLVAVREVTDDSARAGLQLLETVGRTDELHAKLVGDWIETLALVVRRAIAEGDIAQRCDPRDLGRLIVSMYLGLRQTSKLDNPEQFLLDLKKCWSLVFTGVLQRDRVEYMRQFVQRRAALAIGGVCATPAE